MKYLILPIIVVLTTGCLSEATRMANEQNEEIDELYKCPNDAQAFHKYFTECSNDWGNGLTAYGCLKYAHGLAKCEAVVPATDAGVGYKDHDLLLAD